MVGFKTFWITLTLLFIVGACVPQAKQTACKGNEAYDASLRRCVPVTQDPDQAMTFSSYLPLAPIQKHKGEVTPVTLTVNVSNPYTQSYRIVWDRTFNGTTTTLSTTANTSAATQQFTHQFVPATLATQIGLHMFRATIRNAANDSVNVKMFEVVIQDDGTPTVHTPSIEPIGYNVEATPIDPPIQFRLDMNPNASDTIIFAANYKLVWQVYRSSLEVPSQTSTEFFASVPRSGSRFQFSKVINPGHADLGIGNYIIRATVSNSVNTVVAQHTWSLAVNHPQLGLINSVSTPAPGVTTTAYNGLSYDLYPAYNFLYPTAQRPQYCLSLNKPTGTYPADGQGVYVRYYLNGVGAHIYQQETSDVALFEEICLIGGTSTFNQALLKFVNPDNISPQTHKVTVRAFDRRTGIEFTGVNMAPSLGSYPVEWPVLVKSTNSAPVIGFGATKPATCVSNGAFAQDNCGVIQGTPFTVGFTVADDFYDASVATAAQAGKLQWDVKLKHNGADVAGASCAKAFGVATATVGGEYTCTLTVPHYTALGPLHPAGPFSVVATLQDQDSPVDAIGKAAIPLTWNLNVTEDNSILPNVAIAPQAVLDTTTNISLSTGSLYVVQDPSNPASFVTETDTIAFFLSITDPERDHFKYQVSLCKDNTPACTNSVILTVPSYITYTRTTSTDPVLVNALLYTIPEDLLLQLIPAADVNKTTNVTVHFKAEVADIPSVLVTPVRTNSQILTVNVRNFNPAPAIDTASAVPAVGAPGLTVMSGFPFTVDPGSVTDASIPSSEKTISYQWYSKLSASATWTAITGATERILRWTPDTGATGNIDLKLCVGDRPAANPINSANLVPQCSGVWTVTPRNYFNPLSAQGLPDDTASELAVWQDTSNPRVIYSAYASADLDTIFVEKTVSNANGNFNTASFETISFPSIATGVDAIDISNLSITGSANSLYITYLATPDSSPNSHILRLRRINKGYTAGNEKTALAHQGKFGFSANHYTLTCSAPCSVTPSNGAGSNASVVFGVTPLEAGNTIVINGATFTVVNAYSGTPALEILSGLSGETTTSQAGILRQKINASTDARLQGITATQSSSTVNLFGMENSDFIDFDGSLSGSSISIADKGLGKAFISGTTLYIPVINAGLAGAQQNNMTVISGAIDYHLRSPLFNLATSNHVTGLGKMAAFDSQLNSSGELVVAHITAGSGVADKVKLSKLTVNGLGMWEVSTLPALQNIDVFPLLNAEYVRVAANTTGNNSIYVLIRERAIDGGEYHIGRYTTTLTTPFETPIENALIATDETSDIISNSLMKSPEIVAIPNTSEARILFHSVGTPAVVATGRIARWRSDNTISCGTCAPITTEISTTAKIGISAIAPSTTYGTAGSVALENTKDVVFMLTSNLDTDYRPALSVINTKNEPINATAVDGTNHLFRPPFVQD